MTDPKQETVDTYNHSAKALAEYFRGIGSRIDDIMRAFDLANNPSNAHVVEIGCGDGRDAKEIVKRTLHYVGFDVSRELIKLAREHVPQAQFEIADATNFRYQSGLDIVFAFASLLHLDKDEVKKVLDLVWHALKPGGVFYISLKYSDVYEQRIKADQYGRRLFYFYNPELIQKLAGNKYKTMHINRETIGDTKWFDIALAKHEISQARGD